MKTYYISKKLSNHDKIMILSLSIFIILVICGIYLTFKFTNLSVPKINNEISNIENIENNYYIGDLINITGNIVKSENLISYSHTIEFKNQIFGLNSKLIDLDIYTGEVEIKGVVVDKKDNLYILNVNNIEKIEDLIENENFTGDKLSTSNKLTIFDEDGKTFYQIGLIIDLNSSEYLNQLKEGNIGFYKKIENNLNNQKNIYHFSGELLVEYEQNYVSGSNITTGQNIESQDSLSGNINQLTNSNLKQLGQEANLQEQYFQKFFDISSFYCIKDNISENECKKLEERFSMLGFATFINKNGIKFYKLPETNKLFFVNGDIFGYYISYENDSELNNITKYISLINIPYLKDISKNNISKICGNGETKIMNINIINLDYKTILGFSGRVEGTNNFGENSYCNFNININNGINFELIDYKQNIDDKTTINETTLKEEQNEISQDYNSNLNEENQENGQLNFDSKFLYFVTSRGYKIKLPGNSSYEGVFNETNIGTSGIDCNYKINVINYKNKSNVLLSPDLQIYECESNFDENTIKSLIKDKNLFLFKKLDNKYFLISYKQDYSEYINNIEISNQ